MTTDAASRYRLTAWVIGIGAGLLVFGYITADQWMALVGGLMQIAA